MRIEADIRTAEEHVEVQAGRELDRFLGTLTEDCVHEKSLLEDSIQGKVGVAGYCQELI